MPSSVQQSERGIASRRGTGFEVMMTGAGGIAPSEAFRDGCSIRRLVGAAVIGAFLVSINGSFGDSRGPPEITSGGRGGKILSSVVASEAHVIFGGVRRIGPTGERGGRTRRTVSPFPVSPTAPDFGSGGRTIRTDSSVDSAMGGIGREKRMARTPSLCHERNFTPSSRSRGCQ